MRASKRAYATNWPTNFYLGDNEREPLRRERGIEGQGKPVKRFAGRFCSPKEDGPPVPLSVEKPTAQMIELAAAAVLERDRRRDADRAMARDALSARHELELRRKANAYRLFQFNNRWPD